MRTFILLAFIAVPYAAQGGTFADKLTPEEQAALDNYDSYEQMDRTYKWLYANHPDIREAHGFTDIPLEDLGENDAYKAQMEAGGHLESFITEHLGSLEDEDDHFSNASEDPDIQALETNPKEIAILTAIRFCDAADQDESTLAKAFIKMVVHTTLPALKALTNGEFNPDEFTENEKAALTEFMSPEKNEMVRIYKKMYTRHPEIKIAHIGDVAIEDLEDLDQQMLGAIAHMEAYETDHLDELKDEDEKYSHPEDIEDLQTLKIASDE